MQLEDVRLLLLPEENVSGLYLDNVVDHTVWKEVFSKSERAVYKPAIMHGIEVKHGALKKMIRKKIMWTESRNESNLWSAA